MCQAAIPGEEPAVHQVSVEFTEAQIHERAVSHARNEPTSANFHPTSAVRNFKRRAVSTVLCRLSDHRLAVPHRGETKDTSAGSRDASFKALRYSNESKTEEHIFVGTLSMAYSIEDTST